MYKLYIMPGTCSMAVHIVLNELNQPVELINISASSGAANRPEYLKRNPLGSVPALDDDGHLITEGAAIITYLLDKHKSPMLPASGKERATALQWLMFANATMHPVYGRGFFLKRATEDATQAALLKSTVERINELWAIVDKKLGETPYITGSSISAADILLSVIANWSGNISPDIQFGENSKRLFKEISNRPSAQKAFASEQVEYKAAA